MYALKKPLGVALGAGFTRAMDAKAFIDKWSRAELKERSASQEHFIDLCALLGDGLPHRSGPVLKLGPGGLCAAVIPARPQRKAA